MQLLIILILVVNIVIFMLDHFYLSHMDETRHLGVYIYSIYNAIIIGYLIYDYISSPSIIAPGMSAGELPTADPSADSLLNNDMVQNIISYVQSNPAVIKQLSKFLK